MKHNLSGLKRVNIVWHVRTGDISLHNNVMYYNNFFSLLVGIFGIKRRKVKRLLNVVFESQHPIPFLNSSFPHATFNVAHNITSTVCNFLTSDVFISSGSSMSAVLAFAKPLHPIILEERRKEINWEHFIAQSSIQQPHMFTKEMSLHVVNGTVMDPTNTNFTRLLRNVMLKKLGWSSS